MIEENTKCRTTISIKILYNTKGSILLVENNRNKQIVYNTNSIEYYQYYLCMQKMNF